MRLVVDRASIEEVVRRLAGRDPRAGEDARAAVEWLTAGEEEDAPAAFSRRRLQLFLWYELPRKWLIEPEEHVAVAVALAGFFDELGPQAAGLAALCRDPETMRLLRNRGEGFVEAIEASGMEPPDTPLLEWSDLMTIEESLERDAVAEMLGEAIDDERLVPGTKDWKSGRQTSYRATSSPPARPGRRLLPESTPRGARRGWRWLRTTSSGRCSRLRRRTKMSCRRLRRRRRRSSRSAGCSAGSPRVSS